MTDNPSGLTADHLRAVQAAMVAAAGDLDWRRMTLLASAVYQEVAVRLQATSTAGPVVDLAKQRDPALFETIRVAAHRLRTAMHDPEKGTWYNATFALERDGDLEAEYDYDNPPFGGWAAGSLLVTDHIKLPRKTLPVWHPDNAPSPDRWQLFPYYIIDLPPDDEPAAEPTAGPELSLVGGAMRRRIDDAGLDWDRIVLRASAAGPTITANLTVHHPDGTRSRTWTAPDRDFLRRIEQLRDRMNRPGRGTWYNATFTLERSDRARDPRAEYDYDNPPHIAAAENSSLEDGFPDIVDQLREDHEKYPRNDDHLPTWHPASGGDLEALRQARTSDVDDDAEHLDDSVRNWLKQRMIGAAVEVDGDTYSASSHEVRRNEWERIRLTVSAAATQLRANLYIQRPGWEELPEEFIDELGLSYADDHKKILSDLRRRMHKYGTGTWYVAKFTIDESGELQEEYDYDSRPAGIEDYDLRLDQEQYYRHEDRLPAWHPECTDPFPRISLTDQRPATDDPLLLLGYALLDHLPDDWRRAKLYVSSAAETVRTWVDVDTGHDDEPGEEHFAMPDIANECLALRKAMHDPEKGTWYRASITLEYKAPHVGELTTRFDNDSQPFVYWGLEEIELVRQDHELFPREVEELPDWHPLRPRDVDDEWG